MDSRKQTASTAMTDKWTVTAEGAYAIMTSSSMISRTPATLIIAINLSLQATSAAAKVANAGETHN